MPAKIDSFSFCHSAGTAASISTSSGPPRLSVAGMPCAGSNAVDEGADQVAEVLVGWHEGPGARVHQDERAARGRAGSRTMPRTTRPPMEWPSRSTGPPPTASRKATRSDTSWSIV